MQSNRTHLNGKCIWYGRLTKQKTKTVQSKLPKAFLENSNLDQEKFTVFKWRINTS